MFCGGISGKPDSNTHTHIYKYNHLLNDTNDTIRFFGVVCTSKLMLNELRMKSRAIHMKRFRLVKMTCDLNSFTIRIVGIIPMSFNFELDLLVFERSEKKGKDLPWWNQAQIIGNAHERTAIFFRHLSLSLSFTFNPSDERTKTGKPDAQRMVCTLIRNQTIDRNRTTSLLLTLKVLFSIFQKFPTWNQFVWMSSRQSKYGFCHIPYTSSHSGRLLPKHWINIDECHGTLVHSRVKGPCIIFYVGNAKKNKVQIANQYMALMVGFSPIKGEWVDEKESR